MNLPRLPRLRHIAALAASTAALAACQTASTAPPANSAAASTGTTLDQGKWANFRDAFLTGYFNQYPNFAVYQGKHQYDGMLPDWSPAGLAAQKAFLKTTIRDAKAMSGLTEKERFERDYLVHVAQGQLFFLEDADFPHKNPAFYVGGLDPNVYIARPYADEKTRMKAFIKYAENVPAAAAQIKNNLKLPLPETFVKYGQAGFGGFADYYTGDAKEAFAGVKDPALQAQFDAATAKAAAAMRDLSDYVGSQPATKGGFAIGVRNFSKMILTNEGVDTPLDQLEAIGEADLARNQAALREACGQFAPGASIPDCIAKMSADKPEGGPVAEARRQLPMLRQFIIDNDIVTIPGTEQAKVEESPPYNRQNSAYIDIPGPYETGLPSVYYISPPDPNWDAATRAAYIPGVKDLLFTSVHEVWPGHFLNFLHSNRSDSIFGQLFVGYAFAEGWAHYTEEMMYDAGLNDFDPETHIGQLSNALLRDCRFLSAIRLHTGRMTVEQSYDLFRNECYQDEGNARQQAARGTYDPQYLNYTMGKLMIRKLREDWTKGDRSKWKAFHDEFLSYGGPPIPMVRAAMLNEPTARAVF
ncbi:DUF885 domain-containing protein [Novosphingopyxis iocasae]|uniref:DUF885 domain-containing protein n=1 Tax=Novosphingopyxis iocasae TaxID=2762729 RepID=UPI00165165F8|nr:DUF885 domain-containing protein [Novosphingopyxis iocasae]